MVLRQFKVLLVFEVLFLVTVIWSRQNLLGVTRPLGGSGERTEPINEEIQNYISANADLDLAFRQMEFVGRTIENDLKTVEEEFWSMGPSVTENSIADLKDYCKDIDTKINGDFRQAAERFVRLDTEKRTGAAKTMTEKLNGFMDRLRVVQTGIRKARVCVTPASSVTGSDTLSSLF